MGWLSLLPPLELDKTQLFLQTPHYGSCFQVCCIPVSQLNKLNFKQCLSPTQLFLPLHCGKDRWLSVKLFSRLCCLFRCSNKGAGLFWKCWLSAARGAWNVAAHGTSSFCFQLCLSEQNFAPLLAVSVSQKFSLTSFSHSFTLGG